MAGIWDLGESQEAACTLEAAAAVFQLHGWFTKIPALAMHGSPGLAQPAALSHGDADCDVLVNRKRPAIKVLPHNG